MNGLFSCGARAPADDTGAARARPKMDGPVIDMHCHAQIGAAQALVADVFDPLNEAVMRFASDATNAVNRAQMETILPQLTSVERRLADMDAMGIDMQLISPSPFQFCYWAEPELGRDVARTVNDGIAEMVATTPDRFVALGSVPAQAPEFAVAELERCVGELGFKGVELNPNVMGTELSRAGLDRFFARAEELDVILFLHPNGYSDGGRLVDHYFINVIGNPLDTTVCISHLIFDGVLDRHPGLKICAAHGGGYLAAYGARMDHAWGARDDCCREIRQPPTSYLKKLYFDTIVFAPDQLAYLVDQYGSDHIVLGTDYPFDMGEDDPLGLLGRTPGLSDADRAAIAGGNAARLLKLA
jgi:aminocarboxymuconate-semialdehyde decarboxylase